MVMKKLSKLYTANHENRVVCFGTNLTNFYDNFNKIESNIDNYHILRRRFDKSKEIEFVGVSGKTYILQEVYNTKSEE